MIDNEIENRSKVIVRTSIVGIVTNVVLSAFKAVIGFITGSIAVTLDAVNNLSDALSSVITIVGAKLANKLPDKKHPLGYGRIEYLSAMIVAAIVLYAGGTSAVESVKKIITPEAADYSTVSLVIIAAAVVVKLVLGKYVKRQGERVNSGALVASGADALFDAILSASVLASAIVFVTTGISLEAYVGVLISLFIIKSGIEMLKDTRRQGNRQANQGHPHLRRARARRLRLDSERLRPEQVHRLGAPGTARHHDCRGTGRAYAQVAEPRVQGNGNPARRRGRVFAQHQERRSRRHSEQSIAYREGPRMGAPDARLLRGSAGTLHAL